MNKLREYARVIATALRSRGKTVGYKNDYNADFTLNISKDSILIGSIRDRAAYCHATGEGSKIILTEHEDCKIEVELADPNGLDYLADAIFITTHPGRRIGKLIMPGDPSPIIMHGVGKAPTVVDDWIVGHFHQRSLEAIDPAVEAANAAWLKG